MIKEGVRTGVQSPRRQKPANSVVPCASSALIPSQHVEALLSGLLVGIRPGDTSPHNETAGDRLFNPLSNRSATDTGVCDEFVVRDRNLLLKRVAVLIQPTERSPQQIGNKTNDAPRLVRQTNIEELIWAIEKVGVQRREAVKLGRQLLNLAACVGNFLVHFRRLRRPSASAFHTSWELSSALQFFPAAFLSVSPLPSWESDAFSRPLLSLSSVADSPLWC